MSGYSRLGGGERSTRGESDEWSEEASSVVVVVVRLCAKRRSGGGEGGCGCVWV